MARIVRLTATGPYRIDPQEKPVFVCGCGLSQNLPFCDGSHKRCRDEDPALVHVYDEPRQRVIETRPIDGGGAIACCKCGCDT